MMIHYAVCVCTPFVISITKNIISIIWAPPMIVFNNEAWPGQSTKVNCKYYYLTFYWYLLGILIKNAENPKSRVIPLYWDWGFLSNAAVDVISLNILHNAVFPESTWPKTPMLMFMHFNGSILACYYFEIWRESFSISIFIYGQLVIQKSEAKKKIIPLKIE